MKKTAFILPGQGSQDVGMGKELAERYKIVRDVYSAADDVLGKSISSFCFNGPEERLKATEITQPAILTTSIAIYELLKEEGIRPTHVAGHSLGEYSALVAAGVMSFRTAVDLVSKRGKWMAEAVPAGEGTMAAIMGLPAEKVKEICQIASSEGTVRPANYNCPGQVVISGHTEAVKKASEIAKSKGAKRVVLLAVSGPLHSGLMNPVSEKLREALADIALSEPRCTFYANVTGSELSKTAEIKKALVQQVSKPVLWQQTVENLLNAGVEVFVEVGPGKVLGGLVKKIGRNVKILNAEDEKSFDRVREFFKGVEKNA